MRKIPSVLALLLLPLMGWTAEEDLLPPDEAFRFTARAVDADTLRAEWSVADGYYLYRNKLRFTTDTAGVTLGEPGFPAGKKKQDEFFGEVEIYHGKVSIDVPLKRTGAAVDSLTLIAHSQGCADMGVCYPPHRQTVTLKLPAIATAPSTPAPLAELLPSFGADQGEVLDPEVAFRLSADALDGTTVVARWEIAPKHYLYRDKFTFQLANPQGVALGSPDIPAGEEKDDEFFGRIQVFHNGVDVRLPLSRERAEAQTVELVIGYQGCAEAGICYPPQKKTFALELPAHTLTAAASTTALTGAATGPLDESTEARLIRILEKGELWVVVPTALFLGLLMAFTACMYPMIPILSSIIVGQGSQISPARGFGLSLTYVASVAVTFGVVGGITALAGGGVGITASLQSPWLLLPFSLLFIALALAMFGFYNIQVPSALQSRLNTLTNRQKGGTLAGVGLMGVFSALIVGPCGGPVLIAALSYAASSGSFPTGFAALFSLGFGMGMPLLLVGLGGGTLLPRAGAWMGNVKAGAGFILLSVALLFLERMPAIFPPTLIMLLWAALLVAVGVYLWRALRPKAIIWQYLWRGLGATVIVYGLAVTVGGLTGGTSVTDPLHGSRAADIMNAAFVTRTQAGDPAAARPLQFTTIKSVADLQRELAAANAGGKTVMLDFYADWCTYCKQFEAYVFPDPAVQQALADTVLLRADVTATDEEDKALMKQVGVVLPPAILFFDTQGRERAEHRVVGYMKPDQFRSRIEKAFP